MSSNVGLSTPRGSGTSGYVQRNLSVLKPRSAGAGAPYTYNHNNPQSSNNTFRNRKPDQEILRHDRLREIEIKILELRDRLEDEAELEEEEIEKECDALREKLTNEQESAKTKRGGHELNSNGRRKDGIKKYQIHELAEAKIKESERLKRALGLRDDEIGNDAGTGGGAADATAAMAVNGGGNDGEHPMARQERRKREREMERARLDMQREETD